MLQPKYTLKTAKTKTFQKSKSSQTSFSPRQLAIGLWVVALFLASVLAYPLAQLFSGKDGWVLNSGIVFWEVSPIQIPEVGFWNIGEIGLRYYALLLLAGILSGYVLANYLANRAKLSAGLIDKIFLGCLVLGLVGARLVYVLFNWSFFSDDWFQAFNLRTGGLSFFGAIWFAGAYVWWYARQHKFNVYQLLDVIVPGLLLGQVIARWGNLFNYESYGPPTNLFWGMYVPEAARMSNDYVYSDLNAEFFHPTFLYESLLNFGLLSWLLWKYDELTKNRSGLVFAYYAMGYGLIRFVLEFFRLDALFISLPEALHWEPIQGWVIDRLLVSQFFALGLLGLGVYVWWQRQKVLFLKRVGEEVKVE